MQVNRAVLRGFRLLETTLDIYGADGWRRIHPYDWRYARLVLRSLLQVQSLCNTSGLAWPPQDEHYSPRYQVRQHPRQSQWRDQTCWLRLCCRSHWAAKGTPIKSRHSVLDGARAYRRRRRILQQGWCLVFGHLRYWASNGRASLH